MRGCGFFGVAHGIFWAQISDWVCWIGSHASVTGSRSIQPSFVVLAGIQSNKRRSAHGTIENIDTDVVGCMVRLIGGLVVWVWRDRTIIVRVMVVFRDVLADFPIQLFCHQSVETLGTYKRLLGIRVDTVDAFPRLS